MTDPAARFDPSTSSVLVIDDFGPTREAVVTLLKMNGLEAVGAESGPDALDLFQAGMRPCAVLLDLRMPGMDGWETWQRMKALPELAKTPVIILSADNADDTRAKEVGIREFLRKPIHASELTAAIAKYCPPEARGRAATGNRKRQRTAASRRRQQRKVAPRSAAAGTTS